MINLRDSSQFFYIQKGARLKVYSKRKTIVGKLDSINEHSIFIRNTEININEIGILGIRTQRQKNIGHILLPTGIISTNLAIVSFFGFLIFENSVFLITFPLGVACGIPTLIKGIKMIKSGTKYDLVRKWKIQSITFPDNGGEEMFK
jgi:hypothetical protein